MSNEPNTYVQKLRALLVPLYQSWEIVCTNCGHFEHDHYWNGAGRPENAGYDSCKVKDCDCVHEDDAMELKVVGTDIQELEKQVASILALNKQTIGEDEEYDQEHGISRYENNKDMWGETYADAVNDQIKKRNQLRSELRHTMGGE